MANILSMELSESNINKTLPDLLIMELILPRLPVKSLKRFKCVSRYWRQTISSQQFAETHLKFWSSITRSPIIRVDHNDVVSKGYCISFDEFYNITEFIDMDNKYPLIDPNISLPRKAIVVSSCGGLVCMYDNFHFYSWNPAMNQCRVIDGPVINYEIQTKYLGFGYVFCIEDFRIGCMLCCDKGLCHIYIYSLEIGEWMEMGIINRVDYDLPEQGGEVSVCVRDTIYWAPVVDQNGETQIVGLSLVSGKLKKIPLFKMHRNYNDYNYIQTFKMNGCLSMCCVELDYYECLIYVCDVWVSKQHENLDSWEKTFSFKPKGLELLYFFENGKCLLNNVSDNDVEQLTLYDPNHGAAVQQYEPVNVVWELLEEGTLSYNFIESTWGYVETLISPFGTTKAEKK